MMKQFALAPLALAVLSTLAATAHAETTSLGEVTVTATREGQLVNETPATIGVIKEKTLREVKPPMAGGIEISKGPGSALYGSDAIGGVVNVLTRKPPTGPEVEASLEAGSYGWTRAMVTGGSAFGNHAFRADLNLSHTDGNLDGPGAVGC